MLLSNCLMQVTEPREGRLMYSNLNRCYCLQVTEPREGRLMVVYSNLNRLLAAMSVITAPLPTVLHVVKQLNKTACNASVTRQQRGGWRVPRPHVHVDRSCFTRAPDP